MKIRKDERQYVEAVLEQEGDMDTVVEAVFSTVADLLLKRDWYVAAVKDSGGIWLFGPYESEAAGKREIGKMSSAGPEPSTYQLRKMYRPYLRLDDAKLF